MADPYFSSVVLLLPFEHAMMPLADHSAYGAHPAPGGDAKVTTGQSKYGERSLALDGSGDYLSGLLPVALRSGDFTIEFWLRPSNGGKGGSWPRLLQLGPNAANGGLWIVGTLDNPMKLLVQTYASGAYVTVAASANTVPNDAWSHLALCRQGTTYTLFLNGTVAASTTVAAGADLTATALRIGANDSGGEAFYGHLDELRITAGIARYSGAFTPAALDYPALAVSARLLDALAFHAPFPVPAPTLAGPYRVIEAGNDREFGGWYKIVGTVHEKGTPNQPVHRRVRLLRERDGHLVAETWSDPTTGAYRFERINGSYRYTVLAYDHTNAYRAVVADNLAPEPM